MFWFEALRKFAKTFLKQYKVFTNMLASGGSIFLDFVVTAHKIIMLRSVHCILN